MSELAVINTTTGELVQFDPVATGGKVNKADALIAYAKKVRDLHVLEQAVDLKIHEQADFVAWWDANVGVNHGAGRGNKKISDAKSFSVEDAQDQTGITAVQVSRWRKALQKPDNYKAKLCGRFGNAILGIEAANLMSETNEWYTPEHYIESVRAVFGGDIDLDPASCEAANSTVRAKKIFTEKDRSETKEWFGRVFMNPPYGVEDGESRAGIFCRKAIKEYKEGRAKECIILVNSVHAQRWQAPLYNYPVCLVDHRISFVDQHGEINKNPTFMNLFCYLGENVHGFADEFSKHGYVMRRLP